VKIRFESQVTRFRPLRLTGLRKFVIITALNALFKPRFPIATPVRQIAIIKPYRWPMHLSAGRNHCNKWCNLTNSNFNYLGMLYKPFIQPTVLTFRLAETRARNSNQMPEIDWQLMLKFSKLANSSTPYNTEFLKRQHSPITAADCTVFTISAE
jgi:hypothetical protein